MKSRKVEFVGATGQSLVGVVEEPDDGATAFALFAHCFTCGKSLGVIRTISKQLTAEGIALMRFDFTGLGQSEGEFAATNFSTNMGDLAAAARFLSAEFQAPGVLIGHSLGGTAVLATAGRIDSVRCVAVIGAPSEPVHVKHLLSGADFDEDDTAEISIGGRPFRIGRQFIDDLGTHDLAGEIAQMSKPLIIFHSPADTIVGIDNAERIYKAARHPKSFVSLGTADHLVSRAKDAEFLGHVLSAWAGYYTSK